MDVGAKVLPYGRIHESTDLTSHGAIQGRVCVVAHALEFLCARELFPVATRISVALSSKKIYVTETGQSMVQFAWADIPWAGY